MGTRRRISSIMVVAFFAVAPVLLHAANWVQLSPATSPPARNYPAMTYDPVSKRVIMFGGFGANGNLNDTWAFDGTNWTKLKTNSAPPVRNGASMAFDRPSSKIVMFGGFDVNTYLQDTWIFDGATSTWTQAQLTKSPPRATGAMLFTDPLSGNAMMFGGYNANNVVPVYNNTWQWNGTSWKKRNPSTVPYPRAWGTAMLDPAHHNVVLTGGNGDTIRTDNTWTWSGANWAMKTPSVQMEAFVGGGSAYDPDAQAVVVFGGIAETWNWDGTTWTQIVPMSSPSALEGVGMAYDPTTKQTILFGGALSNGTVTNQTWQYIAP